MHDVPSAGGRTVAWRNTLRYCTLRIHRRLDLSEQCQRLHVGGAALAKDEARVTILGVPDKPGKAAAISCYRGIVIE